MPAVWMLSLGCAKNNVDSERLLGALADAGFALATEPGGAELLLVNTCSFIAPARRESLAAIRGLARQKLPGQKLVVTGCLPARSQGKPQPLPAGVDAWLTFADYPRVVEILRRLTENGERRTRNGSAFRPATLPAGKPSPSAFDSFPRLVSGNYAYLKLSEGCDNRCRYCAIPFIRGSLRSRPLGSLVEEAEQLVARGVWELNLIAQDTTSYGRDLYGSPRLPELLRRLLALRGLRWIRLLYAHPAHLSEEVMELLAERKFCRYLDLPLQHISPRILAAMGRKITSRQIIRLLEVLRARLPGIALRTTMLVGFPSESAREYRELLRFVAQARFEHLGAFIYSREELTPAASLPGQVPERTKRRRLRELLRLQRPIAFAWRRGFLGREVEVLVERALKGDRYLARSQYEAPEVDGAIYVRSERKLPESRPLAVRVARARGYDLEAVWPAGP